MSGFSAVDEVVEVVTYVCYESKTVFLSGHPAREGDVATHGFRGCSCLNLKIQSLSATVSGARRSQPTINGSATTRFET